MPRVSSLTLSLTLAITTLTASASAQQPKPDGESDLGIWSSEEATALGHLRRLLAAAQGERKLPIRLPPGGMLSGGYRIACFARGEDDRCLETRNGAPDDDLFLIAWPETPSPAARRGMLLHADGTAMCCEIGAGAQDPLDADLVVGRGAAGTFDDVLRQPGTSESGHFWLWLDQVSKVLAVTVVDEHGQPRPDCEVQFVRLRGGDRQQTGGPWPVGSGVTDQHGSVRIRGPRAHGIGPVVRLPERKLGADRGLLLEHSEQGLRITLTAATIRATRIYANEHAAIATLKNIASAQAQIRATAVIDADQDAHGEYGYFGELTGATVVRGHATKKMNPPVLSAAFARITDSQASRSGYLYQIYLPGPAGQAVAEAKAGGGKDENGADLPVAVDRAEAHFCVYAWPIDADSGQRAFFVNEEGDVLASANDGMRYVGLNQPPAPTAAFAPAATGICGGHAGSGKGADGQPWQVVP